MNTVDEDADLTYRFWRVLRTVYKVSVLLLTPCFAYKRQMMRDRGYVVSDEELAITLDGFKSTYGSSPTCVIKHVQTSSNDVSDPITQAAPISHASSTTRPTIPVRMYSPHCVTPS